MSDPISITAVVALIGAIAAIFTALNRERQKEIAKLREEYKEDRQQAREECDKQIADIRAELGRNTSATAEGLEKIGGREMARTFRRHASDPRGIPVQREDTGRHRQHRELPEVHTDLESERPFPPSRPRRRTRDE